MPTNLLWICLTCPRRARGQKPRASYGKWAKPLTEGHGKTQCFRHFSVSLRPRSGDAAPACPGFLTRCGTVWHRRGRDTQPAVSEGHFLTAAYTGEVNMIDHRTFRVR